MSIKRWDIYWANVRFEDRNETKLRPVVIINSTSALLICLKITSVDRGDEPPEYRIKEWEYSGLPKPSFIRHDKYIRLQVGDLGDRIGTLSEFDRLRLQYRLQR